MIESIFDNGKLRIWRDDCGLHAEEKRPHPLGGPVWSAATLEYFSIASGDIRWDFPGLNVSDPPRCLDDWRAYKFGAHQRGAPEWQEVHGSDFEYVVILRAWVNNCRRGWNIAALYFSAVHPLLGCFYLHPTEGDAEVSLLLLAHVLTGGKPWQQWTPAPECASPPDAAIERRLA